MLDRNIKSLNKMLVKINENMFGGSTKRPPPSSSSPSSQQPQPAPPTTSTASAIAYLPSALLRAEPQNNISLQTLKSSGSSVTSSPSPLRNALGCGREIAARGAFTCSSKSMSMSSFPAATTTTISSTTQQLQKSATSQPHVTVSSRAPIQATVTTALFADRAKLSRHRQHLHHHQQQQQQQFHHNHHHHHHYAPQLRFRLLPGLKATSFFTILTLVCLETVLLSTVSNCAKTFYMHWNTSNSIFRIDNTDHIIDVNKGNLAFEFDQVHIICPVYEPGTFENETEKYIIYNVSKVEYETCRITNADPRVIAICDKPQKLMFFTITFRPFTPQPGGLEFLPGNDYYFISTSSKGDLYRRIGGRCSTNNMKVVFKVCCAPEDKNNRTNNNINGSGIGNSGVGGGGGGGGGGSGGGNSGGGGGNSNTAIQQQQHNNNININGGNIGGGTGLLPSPKLNGMGGGGGGGGGGGVGGGIGIGGNGMNGMSNGGIIGGGGGLMINGNSGTSINTNIDQFNRIPMQQPNNIGGMGMGMGMGMGGNGNIGMNGIGGNGGMGQHQTGIRINNVPSSQQHPSQKNDDYDKHPNEVVKNEELTYNSAASSLSFFKTRRRTPSSSGGGVAVLKDSRSTKTTATTHKTIYQKFKSLLQLLLYAESNHRNPCNPLAIILNFIHNCNPIIITTTVLVALTNLLQYKFMTSWMNDCANSDTLKIIEQNADTETARCQSRLLLQTRKFVNSLSSSFRRRQDEEKEGDLPPSRTQSSSCSSELMSTVDCKEVINTTTTTTTITTTTNNNENNNINHTITR